MNTDEEADESVETDQPAEPTFVYEADFHVAGHPGLNHNSIYVGPLHPWLTSIERSNGIVLGRYADRIAAATGPKGTPEPRLRSMVRNDTGCYQERPSKRVVQAVVHAGAL